MYVGKRSSTEFQANAIQHYYDFVPMSANVGLKNRGIFTRHVIWSQTYTFKYLISMEIQAHSSSGVNTFARDE